MKPLSLLGNVLKTKGSVPGRFLGLDVGDKYVGLAISDPSNMVASPLRYLSLLFHLSLKIQSVSIRYYNISFKKEKSCLVSISQN